MPGLDAALDAFGWAASACEPLAGGLINATYKVRDRAGRPLAVLQRLHPVFGPEVNLDIEAVTDHLAAAGMLTPRLIRTTGGDAWFAGDDGIWRAITFIEGTTFQKVQRPADAQAAGALVGRFHVALSDFSRPFSFQRPAVHDTAAHVQRLKAAGGRPEGASATGGTADDERPSAPVPDAGTVDNEWKIEADELRHAILGAAAKLPALDDSLPRRVCHGDLKISNILFAPDGEAARCLVDLDTMGPQWLAHELGDALRSWSNPAGEDNPAPTPDLNIVGAAMRGYAESAGDMLTRQEVDSIPIGFETICLELAARFALDIFDDCYFGWNAQRYASRRQHNAVRARGQLALASWIAAHRADVQSAVRDAFQTR